MKHTAAEYEEMALHSIKIHNECDTSAEGEADWRNAMLFASLALAAATLEAAEQPVISGVGILSDEQIVTLGNYLAENQD